MPDDWQQYSPRRPLHHEVVSGEAAPYFYGSSLDFEDLIRSEHRHLIAPEREIVPLDGQVGWDPSFEDPHASKCPYCLTDFLVRKGPILTEPVAIHRIVIPDRDANGGLVPPPTTHPVGCPYCRERIASGSLIYCPKCQASGHETRLALQRGLAGTPPPEPKSKAELPAGATRKQKRQSQSGNPTGANR